MSRIQMPKEAKNIIKRLSLAGYEAYIVGGCVRDCLIGREPYDYDIATSAPAEEVKGIFERTIDTGIAHGTVTVIENGKPYEVTTFRIDGEYKDNRHPVSVLYTSDIKDDLARRDFTVNALAYNDEAGIVDAFGGTEDLKNGIIRCVRNPDERFSEDALRVLRGIRFASVLGFKIEENTANAIKKHAPRLRSISVERIYTEWKKLLSGEGAYDVICSFKSVIEVFARELKGENLPPRDAFDDLDWEEKQIALFARSGADGFSSFANRLKMDTKTRQTAISVLNCMHDLASDREDMAKTFILDKSDDVSLKCAKIAASLGICKKETAMLIQELIRSDAVRRISQLSVNGTDLIDLGIKGEDIGKTLKNVLFLVATEALENKKEKIIEYISKNAPY